MQMVVVFYKKLETMNRFLCRLASFSVVLITTFLQKKLSFLWEPLTSSYSRITLQTRSVPTRSSPKSAYRQRVKSKGDSRNSI